VRSAIAPATHKVSGTQCGYLGAVCDRPPIRTLKRKSATRVAFEQALRWRRSAQGHACREVVARRCWKSRSSRRRLRARDAKR